MKDIRIEKVVCNIGCGNNTKIEHAKKLLEKIANKTAVVIKTKKRNTFGIPKGKDIGCKVTIRDNNKEFLDRMFEAKERILSPKNFDKFGNFAFGIPEYINIPEMEYEPEFGVIGLDVCVTLERPGYSVKRRKKSTNVGEKHMINKIEAIEFIKNMFNVTIEDDVNET